MQRSPLRLGVYGSTIGFGMLAMLVGCQAPDKLVHDRFARIQPHVSTQADVTAIIGEPDHTLGDQWMYERPDIHLNAIVDFDASGRVSRKQWIDALGEVWEDSADPTSGKPSYERVDVQSRED